MFKLIENFLSQDYQNELESLMLSSDFGWFYHPSAGGEKGYYDKNVKETYHLTHGTYLDGEINSNHHSFLHGVLSHVEKNVDIKIKELLRIKCNFTVNNPNFTLDNYNPVHVDGYSDDILTFLYYVNDSDGDTRFFDSNFKVINSISPKKGRGILFNAGTNHAGSCPVNYDKRMVINYVFRI